MKASLLVPFLLSAFVLPQPALGEITVPGQISSLLPTELEGFRLGERLEKIRERLETAGWQVQVREDSKRGRPTETLRARSDTHPEMKKLRMMFHEGRLVGLRVDYRRADPERARKLTATCDGHDPLHGPPRRRECIDAERRTAWSVEESQRAEILDVAKMLEAGLLSRAKLERALRRAKREVVRPKAEERPAP